MADYDMDIDSLDPEVEIEISGVRGPRGFVGPEGPIGQTGPKGDTGKQPERIWIDDAYKLNIIFDDGTSWKSNQSLRGPRGNGLRSAELTDNYTILLTFSDGETFETGSVRGVKGEIGATGNGIASAVLNNDYTLTLTWTNGDSYTTPPIRGAKGDTYTLTNADKADIYNMLLEVYPAVEEVEF